MPQVHRLRERRRRCGLELEPLPIVGWGEAALDPRRRTLRGRSRFVVLRVPRDARFGDRATPTARRHRLHARSGAPACGHVQQRLSHISAHVVGSAVAQAAIPARTTKARRIERRAFVVERCSGTLLDDEHPRAHRDPRLQVLGVPAVHAHASVRGRTADRPVLTRRDAVDADPRRVQVQRSRAGPRSSLRKVPGLASSSWAPRSVNWDSTAVAATAVHSRLERGSGWRSRTPPVLPATPPA